MRTVGVLLAVLIAVMVSGPPALAAWSDFSFDFEGETVGLGIGASNPAWTDIANGGDRVVIDPDGDKALGADAVGIIRQSRTSFSDVDDGLVLDFVASVRTANSVNDSLALVHFQTTNSFGTGLVFSMGIEDGRLILRRWSPFSDMLNIAAAANTWYDVRVQYTVDAGGKDQLAGYYRLSGDPNWIFSGSDPLTDLDLNAGSDNFIFVNTRAISQGDSWVDDLSGTPEPATLLLLGGLAAVLRREA